MNPLYLSTKADELGTLAYPALVLGLGLFWRGLTITHPSAITLDNMDKSSSSLFNFDPKVVKSRPTRLSCFAFGTTNLLGSWIMYDGEKVNAAGFNFAWSTLYVIVNGRAGLKSTLRGHFAPMALALLATVNATIYGKIFLWK